MSPIFRQTAARREVLETIRANRTHLTAAEVFAETKKRYPRIGLATVYRTLKRLAEEGVLTQHRFESAESRFELAENIRHHDHLICETCGTIVEFENNAIEELQKKVAHRHGFRLTKHRLDLFGTCPTCAKTNK